jgi:hypothetical protein
MPALTEMLTRTKTSAALDISAEHVRRLSNAGVLPFVDTPYGRLYDPRAVEQLARERAAKRNQTQPAA